MAVRAVIEAEEDWPLELEPDEVLEVCEGTALETAEEATPDETEAEAAAADPEAVDEEEEEETAAAPETILPLPQGIAGPSG